VPVELDVDHLEQVVRESKHVEGGKIIRLRKPGICGNGKDLGDVKSCTYSRIDGLGNGPGKSVSISKVRQVQIRLESNSDSDLDLIRAESIKTARVNSAISNQIR
jgi:hypothetical protein